MDFYLLKYSMQQDRHKFEVNDVLKQIQSLASSLTTETAIFVKSHVKCDCSHFQEVL